MYLEVDVAAGRVGEEEPKVDVHNAALVIDQDIPVVPVADGEQVVHDGVGGEALGEAAARGLARGALGAPALGEVLGQAAAAAGARAAGAVGAAAWSCDECTFRSTNHMRMAVLTCTAGAARAAAS